MSRSSQALSSIFLFNRTNTKTRSALCCALVLGLIAGCSGAPENSSDERTGQAEFTLVSVPPGVACVRLVAQSEPLQFERSFSVVAGTTSVLSFVGLPTGSVTFGGAAYNQDCATINDQSTPTWVAPSVTAVLTSGSVAAIQLRMGEAGQANVTVDFAKHNALYLFDGSMMPTEIPPFLSRSFGSDPTLSGQRCVQIATNLGIPSTRAIAFISFGLDDQIRDYPSHFGVHTDVPVLSPNQSVIANNWADLLDGSLSQSLQAAGALSAPFWYSGSFANGSVASGFGGTSTCDRWRSSSSPFTGEYGSATATGTDWIQASSTGCGLGGYHLMCLGYTP